MKITGPIRFEDTAPIARSSALGRVVGGLWSRVDAAWPESRVRAAATNLAARGANADPAAKIAFGGVVVAAAMLVHIAFLLFVERYPFPSRAALVLPLVLGLGAMVAVIGRRAIAAAWQHRRAPR